MANLPEKDSKVPSPGPVSALTLKLGVCHLGGIRSGKRHRRYHIPTSPCDTVILKLYLQVNLLFASIHTL